MNAGPCDVTMCRCSCRRMCALTCHMHVVSVTKCTFSYSRMRMPRTTARASIRLRCARVLRHSIFCHVLKHKTIYYFLQTLVGKMKDNDGPWTARSTELMRTCAFIWPCARARHSRINKKYTCIHVQLPGIYVSGIMGIMTDIHIYIYIYIYIHIYIHTWIHTRIHKDVDKHVHVWVWTA